MKNYLNPKNYMHLWTLSGLDYFFVSYWLHDEYKKFDLVVIYDFKNKELKFFLSKKDALKLSKYGIKFYKSIFPIWKKVFTKKLLMATSIIDQSKNLNLPLFSNKALAQDLLNRVKFYQSLGKLYLYTETFFLPNVEQKIKNSGNKKFIKIQNNILEMGNLKIKGRKVMNNFWSKSGFFDIYIKEISKRVKNKSIRWQGFKELYDSLLGKTNKESVLGEVDWLLSKYNKWIPIFGKQTNKIIVNFDRYFFQDVGIKILQGQIANKGFYKGRVKIIKIVFGKDIFKEIAKIETGDIIITSTTDPDLMLAIKKAGAIVTEQGGITSHAAIISRELNIPCIIGTKIATKVLHDGDLVEVDANKGIVKILQKAK